MRNCNRSLPRLNICLAGLLTGVALVLSGMSVVAGEARSDLLPLKSAAPRGLGPMALPYLNNVVIGSAHVFGSRQPDLFVSGRGKTSGLYLFKWLGVSEKGAPIFDVPRKIEKAYAEKGTVFQTGDGTIHGLWIVGKSLVHTLFDRTKLEFQKAGEVDLSALPSSAQSVAAFPNPDGTVDLAFELSGDSVPGKESGTDASSADWRPYDAAGISTASFRYRYLFGARLPGLLKGPLLDLRQISPTKREVYFIMAQISPANFGPGRERGVVTGSRMGNFYYYPSSDPAGLKLTGPFLAAGEDGNALRHASVSASVISYPDVESGFSNLIAGGEGAVYFYKFAGRFTAAGAPIFHDPVPVLQENADLYTGTLPTPSVVDWDGDGITDIVVGNSEGFVLFFKNIGTDGDPKFLPGDRIKAGGREIQIQAGYSGSVQGTPEARWGYVSSNVIDWTGDGLPDIIMGDITGNYTVYINRGTKTEPKLDAAHPIYCDGLDLHGMWRSRAAVGKFGNRTALALVDGDDHFHLYWKIDDYNVEDGGKLTLADGSFILTSAEPAGGTGRCKLDFFDGDGDGKLDLIIGTGRRSAIPSMETGYPLPVLGRRTLGTPLFMKNVGTDERPVFEHPSPFAHKKHGLVQPGGSHESGTVGTLLGGGGPNLLAGNENGRLYLLRAGNLKLMSREEAAVFSYMPNPLPAGDDKQP